MSKLKALKIVRYQHYVPLTVLVGEDSVRFSDKRIVNLFSLFSYGRIYF